MRTFVGALPSGNYIFGSGVFLCDEGTPHFVTLEIANKRLKKKTIRIFSEFFGYKKSLSTSF